MLPRYFNAMVRLCRLYMRQQEKAGITPEALNDKLIQTHLHDNGFNWAELDALFHAAKAKAVEQLRRHKENGGVIPIRIRIYNADETETFVVDNFLVSPAGWLRSKILYAVNNQKMVEISAIDVIDKRISAD
jgi:hypothetical protein